MADLLKQMWFLLTTEMYKLWHKGTTLLTCTATEFRIWSVLTYKYIFIYIQYIYNEISYNIQ